MEQETKLKIEDIKVGEGATAEAGDQVTVHYVGTFENGTTFDSSRAKDTPFTFTLGVGQVIQGWDEGVAGMQIGGVRNLTIAPELAYGAGGIPGAIPPNSTLYFEVELIGIQGK
ncbi:MAG: FKBP-type peptidyl-prolyl cis-trans isomerase [Patescibacteria group bacterium]|nr:FKBP-type peptidyl-prolyl cis-trans isomerase [Patescibacteria group bacterium]